MFGALSAIISAAMGCGSAQIRAFHGDADAANNLAVLEIAPNLEVLSVDENVSWRGRSTTTKPLSISFPEGDHSVSIRLKRDEQEGQIVFYQIRTTESEAVSVDGYFRGGRVYRIGFREDGTTWQPTIQDVTPPG